MISWTQYRHEVSGNAYPDPLNLQQVRDTVAVQQSTTHAIADATRVRNHQRHQSGCRIRNLTLAGCELVEPPESMARTRKRYFPDARFA